MSVQLQGQTGTVFTTRSRLVRSILRERFGDEVEQVGSVLLRRGATSLLGLGRALGPGFKIKRVQECVFVLHHHDLVFAHEPAVAPAGGGGGSSSASSAAAPTLYELDEEHVLARLYYPKYLAMISETRSVPATAVVEELMVHSKLPENTLVENVLRANPGLVKREVETELGRLKEEQFVVPHAVLVLAPTEEDLTIPAAKRKKKAQQKTEPDQARYTVHKYTPGFVMLNLRRFDLHFRIETIVKMVRDKYNQEAASIVERMLSITTVTMAKNCLFEPFYTESPAMNRTEIICSVEKQVADHLNEYLDLLIGDPMHFLGKRDGSGGGQFFVPMSALLKKHRRSMLEAYIFERFGLVAQRIFRLLDQKKRLEQKDINHGVMAPWHEIKSKLYQLLSAGCVRLQEIPKTAERLPARSFFVWYVDEPSSMHLLMTTVQTTVANMREKYIHERDSHEPLINRVHAAEISVIARNHEAAAAAVSSATGTKRKRAENDDEDGYEEEATNGPVAEQQYVYSLTDFLPAHDIQEIEKLRRSIKLFQLSHERVAYQLLQLTRL